ncbi:hypothetical protein [Streptomyces sp. 8N616]|uniref:hypothetical protein n=1 Tax=Streptomyces sp. 8N616 TaxID=3457414 RepID=UPI003FD37726
MTAMLLASDGHRVSVLGRDPAASHRQAGVVAAHGKKFGSWMSSTSSGQAPTSSAEGLSGSSIGESASTAR